MKQLSSTRLLPLVFFLFCAASDAAGQAAVFGPETFTRGNGAPQRITRTFSVQDTSGFFDLFIQNSGVTSAVIELNGINIAAPNDFKKQTQQIVKAVNVFGQNMLSVELRGQPGTSFVLSITRAPKFSLFTNPADPLFLRAELSNGDVYEYFGEKNPNGVVTSVTSLSIRYANGQINSYFFDEQSQSVEILPFNGLTLKFQRQSATVLLATVTSADGLTQVTVPINLSQHTGTGCQECVHSSNTKDPSALIAQALSHHATAKAHGPLRLSASQVSFLEACQNAVRAVANICRFVNIGLGIPGARVIVCSAIVAAAALVPGGAALIPAIIAACQPVLLGLQTACLLVTVGDVTGFANYLCQRIADLINAPQWQFLRFLEGNPQEPGDGILVQAGLFSLFNLSAPFKLTGITNGISFAAFSPGNTTNIGITVGYAKSGVDLGLGCAGQITATSQSVVFNGVRGIRSYQSQRDLEEFVQVINRFRPVCNLTVSGLEVLYIRLIKTAPPFAFINTLDAAAIGPGPNGFPGTPIP
jgi:hypothetical protein